MRCPGRIPVRGCRLPHPLPPTGRELGGPRAASGPMAAVLPQACAPWFPESAVAGVVSVLHLRKPGLGRCLAFPGPRPARRAVPTEPLTLTSPIPTPGRTVGAGPAAHSPDLSALTPTRVSRPSSGVRLRKQEEWVTARRMEEREAGRVPGEGEARTGGTVPPGCGIA
ncbi:hypothetical protein J1605_019578 [Eschrichtius robustus]|uniref:Uncharacterized protein n=1 Tax=Eschrichtius robustus TaxID=9764 RepID=A0AB34HKP4_ESCRO|nr:hypothetical protein J1605_019578 [Eschrichtius robustus]